MLTTHPSDHKDLFDQADEPEGTSIARQPAQLDDQLVEVVGEILTQRLHVRLAVLAIGGQHEIDLVLGGILKINFVEIIVIVEIVLELVLCACRPLTESALLPAPSSSNDSYSSSSNSDMTPPPQNRKTRSIVSDTSPGHESNPQSQMRPRYGSVVELRIVDHPLVAHKLTVLRDETTDSPTFRRLTEELVTLLAYEAPAMSASAPARFRRRCAVGGSCRPRGRQVPIRHGPRHARGHDPADPHRRSPVRRPGAQRGNPGRHRYAERLPNDLTGRQCYILDPMPLPAAHSDRPYSWSSAALIPSPASA